MRLRVGPNSFSAGFGVDQEVLQDVDGSDVDLCDTLGGNLAENKIDGLAIR